VVPAEAEAELDVRVASGEQGALLEERIRGLQAFDRRCALEVLGGMNRPPLERTEAVVRLYHRARAAALDLGMALGEGGTGGGSDGSFTAAMGVPTLDGLGIDGGGAHAESEHVEILDIPRRAALLCRLLEALD
jgi:glutamate carboxypeptidase